MKNQALEEEIAARKVSQARQKLFFQAFQSSLEGMLIIDTSGKILEANPAVQVLLDCAPQELIGKSARTLLARLGARRYFRAIFRAVADKGWFKGELQGHDCQHRDFFIWLAVNALRGDDGHVGGYVAVLHAAAGRRELENSLMQTELKYREIFKHAPIAMFRTSVEGRILEVNSACAQLLGYASPEEILDEILDLATQVYVDARDRERYVESLLQNGMVKDFEVRLRRKDGRVILASLDARIIKDADGRVISFDGFMRDVTAMRHAEKERERMQKQLHQSQKLQSLGRLVGGVAHDFNNMLGVIIGQAQLALMKINSENPLQPRLLEIEKAAQRSANLVSQLLAFARKQAAVPRSVDLNEAIAGMLKMLERTVGQHIKLVWNPGEQIWPVKIDPTQVDQILINLVANAQEAISGQGVVTIATENVILSEEFFLKQENLSPGEYVLLKVQDTGCGMDQETRDHIFDPFFTTKEVGRGTGLSLAIVYGIVQQNHGMITVASAPGQGAAFSIYLPRLPADKSVEEHFS
jgi:PAS domain S-box-containing protein